MTWLLYTLFGLLTTWALYLLYVNIACRAETEGRSSDDLVAALPELARAPGRVLIYCFSERCAPCRRMSGTVDELRTEGRAIVKLDIGQHVETARRVGIKATPALLLVEHGRVTRCVIGVKSRHHMLALLGE